MVVLSTRRRTGPVAGAILRRGLRVVALAAVAQVEDGMHVKGASHMPMIVVLGAFCAFVARRLTQDPEGEPKAAPLPLEYQPEDFMEARDDEDASQDEPPDDPGAELDLEPEPPQAAAAAGLLGPPKSKPQTRKTFANVTEATPWGRPRRPTTHDVAEDGEVAEKANSVMAKSLGKNLLDRHRAKKEQEEKEAKQAGVKSALMNALGGQEGPSLKKAVGGAETATVSEVSPWGTARRPSTHTTTQGGQVLEKNDSKLAKKLGKGLVDSFRARKSALPDEVAEVGSAAIAQDQANRGCGGADEGVDFADSGSGLSDSASEGAQGEDREGEQATTWDADAVIIKASDVDAMQRSPKPDAASIDVIAVDAVIDVTPPTKATPQPDVPSIGVTADQQPAP